MSKILKKVREGHSIVYWFRVFMLVLLLLLLFVGAIFEQSVKNMLIKQKVADLNDMLEIYVDELDDSLDALQNYLYVNMSDMEGIVRVETGGNPTQMTFAQHEISDAIADILSWDERVDSLVFYSPAGPRPVLIENGWAASFYQREEIKKALKLAIDTEIKDENIKRSGYVIIDALGESYLIRFYKVRNSYVGMGIKANSILQSLNASMGDYGSILYVTDMEGNILAATGALPEKIDAGLYGKTLEFNGTQYLQAGTPSALNDFYIGRWMPTEQIFSDVNGVRKMLILMIVISLLVVEAIVFIICRFVKRPLNQLNDGMNRISDGDWNTQLEDTGNVQEYRHTIRTFNRMIGEIQNLKIQKYETELQSKNVYLQYLQLQINPHFYLNALNIVYSLAQVQDYKMIQKMIMALTRYLRYHFKDGNTLVTLEEELGHVRSYIDIQQIRFMDAIDYEEHVSDELKIALVPPFVVQSFLENSVKYALKNHQKGKFMVSASVKVVGNEEFLELLICDNGDGYSEETIEKINSGQELSANKDEKVGIRNVMARLDIIYGQKAGVRLANDNGAVTKVYIPLIADEG